VRPERANEGLVWVDVRRVWVGRWIGRSTGGERDLGVCYSHPEKFRNVNDIDIALPSIDWVGNLRNRNNKKIK
jgi:hypothetical protein